MAKTVFIIPGLTESVDDPAYIKIAGYFKEKRIKPVIVPIQWKYRTLTDYLAEFDAFYIQNKSKENIFFGFSLGAMIAFISSTKYNPEKLILGSLSPYFRKDLDFTTETLGEKIIKRYIGSRRMKDYENYDFDKLAEKVKSESYIVYGDSEGPALARRVHDAERKIKNCKLILVKNAKHDISQEVYQEAIEELINKEF